MFKMSENSVSVAVNDLETRRATASFVFYWAADLKTLELISTHGTLVRIVDFIIGAILGATMAHFVVDAGAWRLSQSLQRMYIGKRFAFVFGNHAK